MFHELAPDEIDAENERNGFKAPLLPNSDQSHLVVEIEEGEVVLRDTSRQALKSHELMVNEIVNDGASIDERIAASLKVNVYKASVKLGDQLDSEDTDSVQNLGQVIMGLATLAKSIQTPAGASDDLDGANNLLQDLRD